MTTALRRVESFQEGSWKVTSMESIKKGDVFRMFNPDGNAVVDPSGRTEWTAATDAYLNEDVWEVSVE